MTFPASRVGFAVHHARQGERVLMVVPGRRKVAQVITMIDHFRHLEGETIIRANGWEGFTTPAGGWIRFTTEHDVIGLQTPDRGDLVLVDVDVEWTDQLAAAITLCATRIHADVEGSP